MGHWAAFIELESEMVFASLHGRRYTEEAVAMALDLAAQVDKNR